MAIAGLLKSGLGELRLSQTSHFHLSIARPRAKYSGETSVARIAGVDLPRDKRVEIGLTYIFGIGLTRAKAVIAKTGVNPDTRVKDLSDADVTLLRECVEGDYQIEGDLRRWESMNIKRLVDIGSYRGRRHRMGLPVRGQRTRTNARTRRGRRATVAGKKKAPGKK
jgi:small subunit ribosomal protein S13